MTISGWILSKMRNVSNKNYRENQNTHFMFSNFFFNIKSCRLWDNVEKYGATRGTIDDNRHMRFTCWVSKAKGAHTRLRTHPHARIDADTHKYVIFTSFPRQQWFLDSASLLRYTYIACRFVFVVYKIALERFISGSLKVFSRRYHSTTAPDSSLC
jgi:hypothetical protein